MTIFQAARSTVTFWNGPVPLDGELVIPPGPGPYPGTVVVSGSSGSRDDGPWVAELAHSGLMTLSWDSPGWGRSGGPRRWQSPDQRAPELLAAVDFLAASWEVPVSGVGVVAADLGSWAGIFAATLSTRVEALVLLSPPVTYVMWQETQRLGRRLYQMGFTSAEVSLAKAVMAERIRRLARGEDGPAVHGAEAACQTAPWYAWLPGTTPDEIDAFGSLARYDAMSMLSMLRCPVLAVFVEGELPAVTWQDADALHRGLAGRHERDHRVVVLPGPRSGHTRTWEVTPFGPQLLQEGPFDVIGLISGWLTERVERRVNSGALPLWR